MKQILIVFALLFFVPGLIHAQTELPGPGITPESNFYFLDKFGEALREFFTFNSEAKARLQVTFAGERIAEIKLILENKGVEAPGLAVAQARLESHIAKAADLFQQGKIDDESEEELAREINLQPG